MVWVDFRDQGAGSPDEIRHRILPVLFKPNNEGAGPGSSLAQSMGAHNGWMLIDSRGERLRLSHVCSRPLAVNRFAATTS